MSSSTNGKTTMASAKISAERQASIEKDFSLTRSLGITIGEIDKFLNGLDEEVSEPKAKKPRIYLDDDMPLVITFPKESFNKKVVASPAPSTPAPVVRLTKAARRNPAMNIPQVSANSAAPVSPITAPLSAEDEEVDKIRWIKTPDFKMTVSMRDIQNMAYYNLASLSDRFFSIDVTNKTVRSFTSLGAKLNTIEVPNGATPLRICTANDTLFVLCKNPDCVFIVDIKGCWDIMETGPKGIELPRLITCSADAQFFSVYCHMNQAIFKFDRKTCTSVDGISLKKYNVHPKVLKTTADGDYAILEEQPAGISLFSQFSGKLISYINPHTFTKEGVKVFHPVRSFEFFPGGRIAVCFRDFPAAAITSFARNGLLEQSFGEGVFFDSFAINKEGILFGASSTDNSYLRFSGLLDLPAVADLSLSS